LYSNFPPNAQVGNFIVATSLSAAMTYANQFEKPPITHPSARNNSNTLSALVVMAKINPRQTVLWTEVEQLKTMGANDCVVFPVMESLIPHSPQELLYVVLNPERLVPCYLLEFTRR